jgi:precorrin-2/cobalt-factor-2 C20-methyltransferase
MEVIRLMTTIISFDKSFPGHYYAVGVGPGAADLLTVRAVNIIKTADIIIAPRSSISDDSLALKTIKNLLSDNQTVIDHQYAMIRDEDETIERWKPVANQITDYCKSNKSVVQITIGDPHIYSTIAYVIPFLIGTIDEKNIHIVPGISAFQICASKFISPLTIQEDRLSILPATDLEMVSKALKNAETIVLYKCAKQLSALEKLLIAHGLERCCKVVCYAEQGSKEIIYDDIHTAAQQGNGYMATAIIYAGRKKWSK